MATYFVRTDGNDANTGLGQSAAQAWQTLAKALGATGIGSGDTLYIAPGTYRQGSTITVGGTYSAMTYVYGDPTAAQFTGVPAGLVRITTFTPTDTSAISATTAITVTSKSNLTFANLVIETGTGSGISCLTACDNIIVQDCVFTLQRGTSGQAGFTYVGSAVNTGITVQRCQIFGGDSSIIFNSTATTGQNFKCFAYDNICEGFSNTGISVADPASRFTAKYGLGCVVSNNYISGGVYGFLTSMADTGAVTARNNCVVFTSVYGFYASGPGAAVVASNNLTLSCATNYFGMSASGGRSAGVYGFDVGEQFKFGLATLMRYTNWLASPNIAAGSSSNAPATDQYNVTWYSITPDIGAVTYRNVQNILPTYAPTERNASTITIAPGSTSQSIELYLGATGLTASTAGLSAYYNRTRTADVQIPLVARTIGQAWTSGGFAEVNASTMPGVYRLDLPDAAVAAGADDVTIVVRGASGTNGAVMTVKLSSGGLTAAQTAQAVLDAVASTHNNIGSIGAFIQDKTGYSLSTSQTFNTTGSVGSVTGNVTGNVTGTVGGVVGNIVGNLTGSVGTVATPDNIIDGVWDEQRVGHTASGSFGEKLQTNAMADEMLARDLGSGLNAGTAEERTVRSALRALRNKVNVGSSQMVVKKEDDTTDAWTASVTTTAVSSNVSGIDPN